MARGKPSRTGGGMRIGRPAYSPPGSGPGGVAAGSTPRPPVPPSVPGGPTVLYGPEPFDGTALPAGWYWSAGASDDPGTVAGGALVLTPAGDRTQAANLDYLDPSPATPTALSLRWTWTIVAFNAGAAGYSASLIWDAIGLVTLTGLGQLTWGATPASATGITMPAVGTTTVNELLVDAVDGAYRLRHYRGGTLLATLVDTGGLVPDFSSVGFGALFAANATTGGAPEIRVDDVTVADGYQGV